MATRVGLLMVVGLALVAEATFGSSARSRHTVIAANVPKRRGGKASRKAAVSRKPPRPVAFDDEYDDDDDGFDDGSSDDGFDEDFDDEYDDGMEGYDEDEDEFMAPPPPPPRRRAAGKKGGGGGRSSRRAPPPPPSSSRRRGGGGGGGGRSGGGGGRSGRGGRSSSRAPRTGSSRGMVPYQHYRQGPSMTERMMQATKEMALTAAATSKAAAMAASKRSMDTMKKAQRAAKEKTSSDFEKLLLRATSPEDTPVMLPDMQMLFKEIKYFPRRARGPGVNPYEKTLHKLWNKIAEKDWRTTAKGVDILHRMARDCKPKDCKIFADHVGRLKRARHVRAQSKKKKMLYRYFDARGVVGSLDAAGEPYAAFVRAYFNFVLLRLKGFTGRFDEAAAVAAFGSSPAAVAGGEAQQQAEKKKGKKHAAAKQQQQQQQSPQQLEECPSAEELATLLENMRALVECGLAVECVLPPANEGGGGGKGGAGGKKKAAGPKKKASKALLEAITVVADDSPAVAEPNIVVCDCQYLVADDLEQLWKSISLILQKVLSANSPLALPSGDDTADLCEWWLGTLQRLSAWRKRYKRSMSAIKMRASDVDLEECLSARDVVGALRAMQQGHAALPPGGAAEEEGSEEGGDEDDVDDDEEDGDESAAEEEQGGAAATVVSGGAPAPQEEEEEEPAPENPEADELDELDEEGDEDDEEYEEYDEEEDDGY